MLAAQAVSEKQKLSGEIYWSLLKHRSRHVLIFGNTHLFFSFGQKAEFNGVTSKPERYN